jgi:Type VI secretion system effector, Hcp
VGIGRPWKAVLLVAVGAAGGGAALAVASVPDSSGVIHACYGVSAAGSTVPSTSAGNLRIIDPSANQHCNTTPGLTPAFENTIAWNTAGPPGTPGAPGAPGAPGRSVTIAGGNTLTISGGQVITVGQSPGVTIKSPAFGGHAVATLTLSGGVDLTTDVRSYGLTNTHFGSGGGTGAGARKVQIHEFQITRKGGKTYLTYTLSDGLVSSFQGGSNPHDQQPAESISFNFTKIEIQYIKQ